MCVCVFILLLWSNKWHLYEAQRNSNSLKHDKGMATKGLLEYNVLIDVSTYLQPQVPKYNIRSGEIWNTDMYGFFYASDSDPWQWEEPTQNQENNMSRYSHKGRNNNNNNTQENPLSPWDTAGPTLCDSIRSCRWDVLNFIWMLHSDNKNKNNNKKNPTSCLFLHRCHHHYAYCPACTNYGPTPPPAALPGHDYNQPLLLQMPEPDPPQYPGPPLSSCQSTSPSLVQMSAGGSGLVWQYEGQQSSLSGANLLTADEAPGRNINSNRNIYPKELSIRIISVWGQHTKIINQDFV